MTDKVTRTKRRETKAYPYLKTYKASGAKVQTDTCIPKADKFTVPRADINLNRGGNNIHN